MTYDEFKDAWNWSLREAALSSIGIERMHQRHRGPHVARGAAQRDQVKRGLRALEGRLP